MLDFGIISLVLIQIIIAIICLWSWHSNKIEYQTLKAAFSEQKSQLEANGRIVMSCHEKVTIFERRIVLCESMQSEVERSIRIAEDSRREATQAVDNVADVEKSMKARMSALTRWNRPKEERPEDFEPENAVQEEIFQIPAPPLAETKIPSTFGKVASR